MKWKTNKKQPSTASYCTWTKTQTVEPSKGPLWPSPCLPLLLPPTPISLFSYSGYLSVPQTCQALSYPWAFVLIVPFAWNMHPHLPHGWLPHPLGCDFLKEALCDYSIQRHNTDDIQILFTTPRLPPLSSFTGFITSCNYPVCSLLVYCLSPFPS